MDCFLVTEREERVDKREREEEIGVFVCVCARERERERGVCNFTCACVFGGQSALQH